MRRTLGWLRMERDDESPPVRVWRDWLLVAGVAGAAMVEVVVRDDDPVWLWRRAHPLAMVALWCGPFLVVDLASQFVAGEPFSLNASAFVMVLVYSLFRWGTSRQAAIGLVIVLSL